jgi:hypothetical protein
MLRLKYFRVSLGVCPSELPSARAAALALIFIVSFGPTATAFGQTKLKPYWLDNRSLLPTSRPLCVLADSWHDSLTVCASM